jgi:hypothetical protein
MNETKYLLDETESTEERLPSDVVDMELHHLNQDKKLISQLRNTVRY